MAQPVILQNLTEIFCVDVFREGFEFFAVSLVFGDQLEQLR